MFLTAWQLQRVDEILSRSAQSYTGFCLTMGAKVQRMYQCNALQL